MKSRLRYPANAASRTDCLWRDDRGVSGKVGEQLRLKAEYLVAENRILRSCTIERTLHDARMSFFPARALREPRRRIGAHSIVVAKISRKLWKSGWLSWYRNDVAKILRRGDGYWVRGAHLLDHDQTDASVEYRRRCLLPAGSVLRLDIESTPITCRKVKVTPYSARFSTGRVRAATPFHFPPASLLAARDDHRDTQKHCGVRFWYESRGQFARQLRRVAQTAHKENCLTRIVRDKEVKWSIERDALV